MFSHLGLPQDNPTEGSGFLQHGHLQPDHLRIVKGRKKNVTSRPQTPMTSGAAAGTRPLHLSKEGAGTASEGSPL